MNSPRSQSSYQVCSDPDPATRLGSRPTPAVPARGRARTERTAGIALVVSLLFIVTLAGMVSAFPRDVPAGTARHALATSGAALAHTLLGILVLGVAVALGAI